MYQIAGIVEFKLKPKTRKPKSRPKGKDMGCTAKSSFTLEDPPLCIDPSGAANPPFSPFSDVSTIKVPSHIVFTRPFSSVSPPAITGAVAPPQFWSDACDSRCKEATAAAVRPAATDTAQMLLRRGSELVNEVRAITSLAARLGAASSASPSPPSSTSRPASTTTTATTAASLSPTAEWQKAMAEEWREEMRAHERDQRTAEREMKAERDRDREWRREQEKHLRELSRTVELGMQNARQVQEIEQRRMVAEAVEKAVAAAAPATVRGAGGRFESAEWWLNDPSREREWERRMSRPWEREAGVGFCRERRRSSLGSLMPRGISLARGFVEMLAEVELVERQYEREREGERGREKEREWERGREKGRRDERERGEREKERDMFWPVEGRYVGKVGRRFGLDRSSGY